MDSDENGVSTVGESLAKLKGRAISSLMSFTLKHLPVLRTHLFQSNPFSVAWGVFRLLAKDEPKVCVVCLSDCNSTSLVKVMGVLEINQKLIFSVDWINRKITQCTWTNSTQKFSHKQFTCFWSIEPTTPLHVHERSCVLVVTILGTVFHISNPTRVIKGNFESLHHFSQCPRLSSLKRYFQHKNIIRPIARQYS